LLSDLLSSAVALAGYITIARVGKVI